MTTTTKLEITDALGSDYEIELTNDMKYEFNEHTIIIYKADKVIAVYRNFTSFMELDAFEVEHG